MIARNRCSDLIEDLITINVIIKLVQQFCNSFKMWVCLS